MPTEINVGMPRSLDIGAGYTIRATCLDASGAVVAGAKIGAMTITADFVGGTAPPDGGGDVTGDWLLVPGPAA